MITPREAKEAISGLKKIEEQISSFQTSEGAKETVSRYYDENFKILEKYVKTILTCILGFDSMMTEDDLSLIYFLLDDYNLTISKKADKGFYKTRIKDACKIPPMIIEITQKYDTLNNTHLCSKTAEYLRNIIEFAVSNKPVSMELINCVNDIISCLNTYSPTPVHFIDEYEIIDIFNWDNLNDTSCGERYNSEYCGEQDYDILSDENITQEEEQSQSKSFDEGLENCLNELNSLIGLKKVKNDVNNMVNMAKVQNIRKQKGLPVPDMSLHMVYTGNPGTGKTTVARIVAKIYREMGILKKGHMIETDRAGLVAGYVGQTALKVQEVVNKALGGVLFIDEAYTLAGPDPSDFGFEAIDTLLKMMEDHRNDLIVIAAGYTELMNEFINSNPGLASRFNKEFAFEDYSLSELMEILDSMCIRNGYNIQEDAKTRCAEYFGRLRNIKTKNFGNAREVRNFFEKAISNQATRLSKNGTLNNVELQSITADDIPSLLPETINDKSVSIHGDAFEELNSLIGLEQVKRDVARLVNGIKIRRLREEKGMHVSSQSLHMVFTGNPGTGKTTVARLIARIYRENGMLYKGQLIETDRSGLVGGYSGQTALKVQEVVSKALGGILFIDEAYTLTASIHDDYGREAVDTLLKLMEDNRNNLIVIAAGYSQPMETFLDSNPGLRSRFNKFFNFEDYTADQLLKILSSICSKEGYRLTEKALNKAERYFEDIIKNKPNNFANAREARNYFEKAVANHADRIAGNNTITEEDLVLIDDVDLL